MAEPLLDDVSDTALWVASYRADESERPDALFADPFARRLAGDRGRELALNMPGASYTAWSVVIRTCVIDAYINEAVAGGVDTVLNLGAGLDTRPYRLALPESLRWIEIDHPRIVALKDERLRAEAPRCRLHRIALDLADRGARQKVFAEIAAASRRVLVLTEGVVPYLSNTHVAELGRDLRALEPLRHWIVDYFAPPVVRYMQRGRRRREMQNAPFRFAPASYNAFFVELGWRVAERRFLAEVSEKLGRPVPWPWWLRVTRAVSPRAGRVALGRLTGYLLLEAV